MLLDLFLFSACALIGVRLQLRDARAETLRDRIWRLNYVALIPIAAAYAFLTIELNQALLATITCALVAWWLTVLLAGGYARLVSPTRPMRGALWLVGAFPNTGFLGFPLAYLAFGTEGLRLAVVYDQISLVIPAIVVSNVIARRHSSALDAPAPSVLRELVTSPPLWSVAVLMTVRATVLPEPLELPGLGTIVGTVVGSVGFLLLGLSMPLHDFTHDRRETLLTSGAMSVRLLVAPALVWLVAGIAGVDVPSAIYLIAAMPTAFHALIVARRYSLEVAVLRLGVLVTSVIMIAVTVIGTLVAS